MPDSLAAVDGLFSRCLDIDLTTMTPGEVRVAASARRYEPEPHYARPFAVWLLVFRDRCAVSVRPELLQSATRVLRRFTPDTIRTGSARTALLSAAAVHCGPAQAGSGPVLYCRPDACWLWRDHPCRRLEPRDIPALEREQLYGPHLHESAREGTCFVALDGGDPVSLCGTFTVPFLGDAVADMNVAGTLQTHRRRHFGRTAVAHSTDAVLRLGRVPVYSTSDNNVASVGTARSVGYSDYGWSFRVELSEPG